MERPAGPGAIRRPAVAGSFYPASAGTLADEVDALLRDAPLMPPALPAGRLLGVIVPHAGYVYSGPVAATAYGFVRAAERRPSGVVILGPSHFWPLTGAALPGQAAWQTPLGEVTIDGERRQRALAAGVVENDAAHASEHSIEVQLPFLQRLWPGDPAPGLLPIAVGPGSPEPLASRLATILDEDWLLVVSTDLSHYHASAEARRLDARTAAAIEALDVAAISDQDACGSHALRAALSWARGARLRVRLLDLRSSADTAGSPDRVVGYGAFAIERADPPRVEGPLRYLPSLRYLTAPCRPGRGSHLVGCQPG